MTTFLWNYWPNSDRSFEICEEQRFSREAILIVMIDLYTTVRNRTGIELNSRCTSA
jgi:hypothetical protein